MEVQQFVADAQNMRERLPPVKFYSLEESLSKMVDALQEAEQRATETPIPGIQASSRVAGICTGPASS
ncbi:hypothetical protein JOM56_013179 [Amanita muscaria]